MNKLKLHFIVLLITLFSLSACFEQKTPQEVSEGFWQAVISNDINDIITYSTLNEAQAYEGFSHNFNNMQASWGKIIIEGNQASIDTVLTNPNDTKTEKKEFRTYLVLQNEEWKVDYAQTRENMRGDVFSNLFDQLNQLGDNISQQLNNSTDNFNAEMERMQKELNELTDSISQQATESINKYAEILRKKMDDLADSIERVLKEQEKRLSDKDKRLLTGVADDLNKNSQNLADPDISSIAEGSKSITSAMIQLETTDDGTIGQYKKQWRKWAEEFEADMQKMLDELSISFSSEKTKRSI